MTKDDVLFLVMGFTGRKTARFKEAYIAEFNRMEQTLREQQAVPPQPIRVPQQELSDAALPGNLHVVFHHLKRIDEILLSRLCPAFEARERMQICDEDHPVVQ